MKKRGTKLHIFGKRLKKEREKIKLTQRQFAEKLNVSFDSVKNWEQHISLPEYGKLFEIADFFNTDIDYLLGRIDEKKHGYDITKELTGLSEETVEFLFNNNKHANEGDIYSKMIIQLVNLLFSSKDFPSYTFMIRNYLIQLLFGLPYEEFNAIKSLCQDLYNDMPYTEVKFCDNKYEYYTKIYSGCEDKGSLQYNLINSINEISNILKQERYKCKKILLCDYTKRERYTGYDLDADTRMSQDEEAETIDIENLFSKLKSIYSAMDISCDFNK